MKSYVQNQENTDFILNFPLLGISLAAWWSKAIRTELLMEALGCCLSLQHTALVHKIPRDRAIFMSHHTVLVGHLRLD